MKRVYFNTLIVLGMSIVLTIVWPYNVKAQDMGCRTFYSPGLGPIKRNLPSEEMAHTIRRENKSFYSLANEFASDYGGKFVDLVLSRLSGKGKTTIVIAMGGAEHLGTLLEFAVADKRMSDRVDIQYIPLSTEIVRPYLAQNRGGDTMRGIGPAPKGYRTYIDDGLNPQLVLNFLKSFRVFENSKVLVLDTGFRGTIPGVINFAGSAQGYSGLVEGVLVSGYPSKELKTSIFSLNQTLKLESKKTDLWARRLDGNNEQGATIAWSFDAFQRSYRSMPIFDGDNIWVKNTNLESPEEVLNYSATLLGLQDGIRTYLSRNAKN